MIKKTYIQPETSCFPLVTTNQLLSGSNMNMAVSSDAFDDETMEVLAPDGSIIEDMVLGLDGE